MFTTILNATAIWLHMIATVLLIGYYLLQSLVFLPALEKTNKGEMVLPLLGSISRRIMPIILGSILVFIVTGIVMMMVNPAYQGFGNFFANVWSILMTIKHVLILGMIALGSYMNVQFRKGFLTPEQSLGFFRTVMNTMAFLGVLVLLLTAICQAQ